MVDDVGAELDELDTLLDPESALEAQFRELEQAPAGAEPPNAAGVQDPLDAMKRAMGGEAPERSRLVLVVCPRCGRKNRTPIERLQHRVPRCGACGATLVFTR